MRVYIALTAAMTLVLATPASAGPTKQASDDEPFTALAPAETQPEQRPRQRPRSHDCGETISRDRDVYQSESFSVGSSSIYGGTHFSFSESRRVMVEHKTRFCQ